MKGARALSPLTQQFFLHGSRLPKGCIGFVAGFHAVLDAL